MGVTQVCAWALAVPRAARGSWQVTGLCWLFSPGKCHQLHTSALPKEQQQGCKAYLWDRQGWRLQAPEQGGLPQV